MLIVRDDQIEAFEEKLFAAMQQRVERAIAQTFPEFREATPERQTKEPPLEGHGQPPLKSIVERGIESAVRFDIQDGPDIAAFIALGLALRLAPVGEAGTWISDYLNRAGSEGQTKLSMVESQVQALAADDQAFSVIAQRVAQARDAAAP